MNPNEQLDGLLQTAFSRRNFVRGSFATVGALALGNVALGQAFAAEMTDLDILNFALTLEHLEARMYKDMLATNLLSGKELSYFQNFGKAEAAHVQAVAATVTKLGGTPVQPKAKYNFPAFDSRDNILKFAKTAEDIGVGAYSGAAPAIKNKDVLAAAGSILQIEARHAAIVNELLGLDPVPAAFTSAQTVQQVLDKVNPILGS